MSRPIRVRFAPSPTGYLHVGGARTALYNYLFAKNQGGQFILRIEDTDVERSTDEALRMQISDLQWLGLTWDEGVNPDTLEDEGGKGPYRQSKRLDIYKKYANQLIESGEAYYCFMTDEETEAERTRLKAEGKPLQVQSPWRDKDPGEAKARIDAGEVPVVRFKVPQENSEFVLQDLVRGEVKFPSEMVGDFVLMRSNGMPVYNFCCAIDDALMEISHVFRAEEHLNNSLRQMMIYDALGFEKPEFGHLSIILGEDKQKLSKRHGATSCNQYREMGYLPEAMLNFMALLGWSHPEGKEVMPLEEMVSSFGTDRLNPASAVFDDVKLKWMNSVHLRELDHGELWQRLKPSFDREGFKLPEDSGWQDRALTVFKTSIEVLEDAVELFRPLSQDGFKVLEESAEVLSWETTKPVIEKWITLVEAAPADYLTEEQFVEAQNTVKTECGVKGKQLFMPIRVAIIGKPQGADLKQLVPLMTKATLLDRAKAAIGACN